MARIDKLERQRKREQEGKRDSPDRSARRCEATFLLRSVGLVRAKKFISF
jgi:hypothetical protein